MKRRFARSSPTPAAGLRSNPLVRFAPFPAGRIAPTAAGPDPKEPCAAAPDEMDAAALNGHCAAAPDEPDAAAPGPRGASGCLTTPEEPGRDTDAPRIRRIPAYRIGLGPARNWRNAKSF